MTVPQKIHVVGAAIGRPLLAGVAIRIRIVRIVFASARPVTIEIVILFPFCCGISGAGFEYTPHPSASPTPSPQGEGKGQNRFSCRSIFAISGFSDRPSASSCVANSLPLEGKVGRRYTCEQPWQEIIGLMHERQHEASIRTGRAPSTGEPDEVGKSHPDAVNNDEI